MHEFINNFVVFVSDFVTEKQISFDKGSVVRVRDAQDGIALVESVHAAGAQHLIPVSVLRRPIDLVLAWEKAEPMPPSIYQRLRDRLAFTESAYLQVAENLGVPYPGWKDESDSHVCGQNVADVEERAAEANAALQCTKDLAEILGCGHVFDAIKMAVKACVSSREEIRESYRQACDDYAKLAYILGVSKKEVITHGSRSCISAIEERGKSMFSRLQELESLVARAECVDKEKTEVLAELRLQISNFESWLNENHPIQQGDPCLPHVRATWVIERLSKELDARRKTLLGRDFTTKSKLAEFMSDRLKPFSFQNLPDIDQTAWNHALHYIQFLERNNERVLEFVKRVAEKVGLREIKTDQLDTLENRLSDFIRFWMSTSIAARELGPIELTQ